MLTKPALSDPQILSCLQEAFGLQIGRLDFLPIGADINTAVYRAATKDGTTYFVKLRKGEFQPIQVTVPHFLAAHGVPSLIPPLAARSGLLWVNIQPYKVILYPYIEGKNAYQQTLTPDQWVKFGEVLHSIHSISLPVELTQQIPCETYSAVYREQVKAFQAQAETTPFHDPSANQLAQFMHDEQERISALVTRGDEFGKALKSRPGNRVLCHSDIHPGNLHLHPDGRLYIVDWDNPTFSAKERDLNLIGGCATWNQPEWSSLFTQGYGNSAIDTMELAYYRCERIIQDIAAYCEQMFLSTEGGDDRAQGVQHFIGQFTPGHEIDLAMRTGPN